MKTTTANFCLIKEGFYSQISDIVYIQEELDDNTIMTVEFSNNSSDYDLYHLFCEANSKKNENSRIKFFKVDNFPDGVFVKISGDSIEVSICELKRTPANKLEQLTRQLFSGFVHSRLLLKMLDCEEEKVTYRYRVFMLNDTVKEAEYNSFSKLGRKITPGTRVVDLNEYQLWGQNKLLFKEQHFSHLINVEKYVLNNTNKQEYQYSISL
ncbi:hypothetical protein [Paenibacillus sp. Marseille-Q9583]